MKSEKKNNRLKLILAIIVVLFVVSWMLSGVAKLFTGDSVGFGNVAVIYIRGMIVEDAPGGLYASTAAASSSIVEKIIEANNNPTIKAIIFDINSGGGTAVASEEIMNAITKVDKPTVSVIHEIGASGAYWVASATDHIIANPLSAVGSIGVVSSYVDVSGLLDQYNVTYNRLVTGKYKDMGSPYKKLTDEEETLIMDQMEYIHEYFVRSVAFNRNLDFSHVSELAEGQVFMGEQAFALSLVDELGSFELAETYIENEINETITLKEYVDESSFIDLFKLYSKNNFKAIGQGIGESLVDSSDKDGYLLVK